MRRWMSCAVFCVSFPVAAASAAPSAPREAAQQLASQAMIRGRVVDSSGAAIVGAQVTVTADRPGAPLSAVTNAEGVFTIALLPGAYTVRVNANGFVEASRRVAVTTGSALAADFALEVAGIHESVTVDAAIGYAVPAVSSATKTTTPLRDVPQAVSVVSSALIADQRMASMADVTRYMPGVGFAQGEGNRDTPILRGNSTTSDFFVDGVRDDVQYFRDVYNVDRVEALKGPNAMIFGRGGVGGVINRVTRQADWGQSREASLQLGSWDNKRVTADVGRGLNDTAAIRATALYENSDSYRNGFNLERYGFNPTVAFRLGANTTFRGSYEYFHDERIADRGISSFNGRPVDTDPGTFFGDPTQSESDATVNLVSGLLEHRVSSRVTLRNRLSYGDYGKFYQNVFPGAVNAAGTTVAISAYNNATARQNLFNQTDLVVSAQTGRLGHTLLMGAEVGRQETSNFRATGFFSSLGATVTTFNAPLDTPTISLPLEFRQNATDADNHGVTTVASVYAQDQVALSRHFEAVVGLRFESFNADVTNNRTATDFASDDGLLSPRLGLIYKPIAPLSLYGSYSLTYLPRAGEQLSSLSLTNQALDPEEFRNYEVGAKWDVVRSFSVHRRPVSAGPWQRHRARSHRSGRLDPGRRAAHQGPGARREREHHPRLERGGRLCLSGWGDHAVDLGHGTGRRDAGAVAEALGVALEQVRLHLTAGHCGGRPLSGRRVHLNRQPGRAAQLDPRRRRGLLQPDRDVARADQHREPVRQGVPPQRAQQYQHHAGVAASDSVRPDDALLTPMGRGGRGTAPPACRTPPAGRT